MIISSRSWTFLWRSLTLLTIEYFLPVLTVLHLQLELLPGASHSPQWWWRGHWISAQFRAQLYRDWLRAGKLTQLRGWAEISLTNPSRTFLLLAEIEYFHIWDCSYILYKWQQFLLQSTDCIVDCVNQEWRCWSPLVRLVWCQVFSASRLSGSQEPLSGMDEDGSEDTRRLINLPDTNMGNTYSFQVRKISSGGLN